MQTDSDPHGPFPVQHAFVVQFVGETSCETEWRPGRVEHIVSGQAARFHSRAELFAFFDRLLEQPSPSISDGSATGSYSARLEP